MTLLFSNIKNMKKNPSLSLEQQAYFKRILVAKFSAINKNPAMTAEVIAEKLSLDKDLTIVKRDVRRRSLDVGLHYLFDGVPFLFEIYVKFDKVGEYTHYFVVDGEDTGLNLNRLLHLFPVVRGNFSLQLDIDSRPDFARKDQENHYIAKYHNVFNFENKLELYNVSINYAINDQGIVKKHFKYVNSGNQFCHSPEMAFHLEHEIYFIDFMNLLHSNESELITNYFRKEFYYFYPRESRHATLALSTVLNGQYNKNHCSPFMLGDSFKVAGDLFIELMNSPHKEALIAELKVYEMSTY